MKVFPKAYFVIHLLIFHICLIVSNPIYGAEKAAAQSGDVLYLSNCAVCHRPQGEGIDKFFPALKNNAYVMGDIDLLIATVLNGRGAMPAFNSSLNDQQLSKILQYVRRTFANNSDEISPAMVAAAKKSISEKITSDHDVQ